MDALRGVWCGMLIALLITAAQGQQWTQQSSGTTQPLYGVAFANVRCGWAVGGSNPGIVIHTTDGGVDWETQSVATPFSGPAYAVTCTDTLNAWLSGGNFVTFATIQHTTDGGDNWTAQTSGAGSTMKAIVFVDSVNGWAAGGGTTSGAIFHTTNGGSAWDTQVSGAAHTLIGMDFSNDHTGWAVGRGGDILHTTDAGATWNAQTSGITTDLYHVDFRDTLSGWAAGASGIILHTEDGGQNWGAQNPGISASIWSIAVAGNEVWAVGDSGTILHTTNDGTTWTRQNSGVSTLITAVCFPVPWQGWAVMQNGTILHHISDTTHTNTPPGPFMRMAPPDTALGNVGMGVWCRWTASHDSDGDSVRYVFHMESTPNGWPMIVPSDTVTSDTAVFVILAVPTIPPDDIVSFAWTVRATDGQDTVAASNGEGHFTADIPTAVSETPDQLPRRCTVQAFPNPFNLSTVLRFTVPRASDVSLEVFDILGRKTCTLCSGYMQPGDHSVEWTCPHCASGQYVARLQAGNQTLYSTMMLLK